MQLKKFMCFKPVTRRSKDSRGKLKDKCHYVQTVIETLQATFKKCWNLGQFVSTDEGGVPYKGKMCPIKCYNSKKSKQWFIKLWLLTCARTSYCWNFKIYEGKGEDFRR